MQVEATIELPLGGIDSVRVNAGTGEITGGEVSLWWLPTDGLDVRLGASVLDAEVTEWNATDAEERAEFEGNSIPDAPELTYNGLVRYQWTLGSGLAMSAHADFSYSDEIFKDIDNTPN